MEKEDQAAASNPPLDVVTVTAAAEAEATDEKQPPEPQPTAEGSVPSDADDSEIAAVDPNSTLAALSESRWEEMFERLLQFKVKHICSDFVLR